MKRIIVTGGTGFVGANLTRRLVSDGHQLHLLVRPEYRPWRLEAIRSDVQFHVVALDNLDGLSETVRKIRPDWVFHLAVSGAYSWQSDVQQIVQTNIIGTINLVQACLESGFEAFVNTGSSSEYGLKDHAPTEESWLEPNSYYAVSKASATLFCRYAAQRHQLCLPTLRLYSVYGPYEAPKRLIPTLIAYGLYDQLPPLVNPNIARDFVYIDDVVEAYLLAATVPNQELGAVYNVGTGTQTTLREVVNIMRRLMTITAEPEWETMPARQWDTSFWQADSRKIQHELGWQPAYSLEQGLRLTTSWLRDDPPMRSLYTRNVKKHGSGSAAAS